jgi:hypothetical protein
VNTSPTRSCMCYAAHLTFRASGPSDPAALLLLLPVAPVARCCSCILPVFCASMLLMTSCRDPGILPRQEPDEEWLQGRKPR